jgi:hypothetical protein
MTKLVIMTVMLVMLVMVTTTMALFRQPWIPFIWFFPTAIGAPLQHFSQNA